MKTAVATSLVTGGAGFIGSHVAKHCLELGHRVIVLDDLSGGFLDQVPSAAVFIQGSVTDDSLVASIFRTWEIDYVYHLAAYAAEGMSHFIRRYNYTNNILGSATLINHAVKAGVRCFVFTSSIAVYGQNRLPMTEELVPQPIDPYGIAKFAVELDLAAARRIFGLNFIIFRPHNVYGEHQNLGDPYRNVIGIFMRQLMSNEPLTVFGDGTQQRAFSYIDDVAPYIASSVHIPSAYNEVFNIGGDVPVAINDLVAVLARVTGITPRVEHLPARDEVHTAYADHRKVKRVLGAIARTSLEEGLQRMWEWARKVGVRSVRPFAEVELDKGMPESWRRIAGIVERGQGTIGVSNHGERCDG